MQTNSQLATSVYTGYAQKVNIYLMKNRNITHNAPIGKESWFGCGGSADLLFRPNDAEELSVFLQNWPLKEPLTIIGGLANTIIRDGGLRGATVQLGKGFSEIVILSKSPLPSGERARVRGKSVRGNLLFFLDDYLRHTARRIPARPAFRAIPVIKPRKHIGLFGGLHHDQLITAHAEMPVADQTDAFGA